MENGMLWCVTKLFVNEDNFQGNQLLKHYKIRLFISILIAGVSLLWALCVKSYWKLLVKFGKDSVVENMCCSITTGELTRQYSCYLPSTGDLPQLIVGFVFIHAFILLINLDHIRKFYLSGNNYLFVLIFDLTLHNSDEKPRYN